MQQRQGNKMKGEVGHTLTVNSLEGEDREKARTIVSGGGFRRNVLPSKEAILHKIESLSKDIRVKERDGERTRAVVKR